MQSEADIFDHGRNAAVTDPISFEVIRHKLQAIVEEQAITLRSVSGSPVATEATDFNCGLYLPNGDIVVMGPQVLFHSGTMSSVIKNIIAEAAISGGIHEGDMFILNDPYRGAIHQPDMSIVAPIFYEGECVGWAGSCAHQLDVGGMSFGSWAYKATEVQQEAMLLGGIKLMERGEIRQDLWRSILSMSRLPDIVGLDFKAMIAANTIAMRRIRELLERYGSTIVREVMTHELDVSEEALRRRLLTLPDGRFAARDYLDHDGHENRLYQVQLTVEKRGDKLRFDLTGTSPQAPGFINCTYSGLRGALFAAVLPILAPDIRWNEGIMRGCEITVPEALLCNARFPAPVSGATVSTAWVVTNVAVTALSRMVACSAALAKEGQAVTKGHMSVLTLAGATRDGAPYGNFIMDAMAGGGGAYLDHDGLDGSGDYVVPRPQISNVENAEANGPILYLFRSFLADSAGAGRFRGGVGAALAITPYETERLHAMIIGHGVEVPNSVGLFGGFTGSCGVNVLYHAPHDVSALINKFPDFDSLSSTGADLGAKPGHMDLKPGDVLGYSFQGGGGYGDPLLRDPSRVMQDIAHGLVSEDQAALLYGVAATAARIDERGTEILRDERRRDRLSGKAPARKPPAAEALDGPSLRVGQDRNISCACGTELAAAGENWKARAVSRNVAPHEVGRRIRLHAELYLTQWICPNCATLLELSVERRGVASLETLRLDPHPRQSQRRYG